MPLLLSPSPIYVFHTIFVRGAKVRIFFVRHTGLRACVSVVLKGVRVSVVLMRVHAWVLVDTTTLSHDDSMSRAA